jgi:hypothetical protein
MYMIRSSAKMKQAWCYGRYGEAFIICLKRSCPEPFTGPGPCLNPRPFLEILDIRAASVMLFCSWKRTEASGDSFGSFAPASISIEHSQSLQPGVLRQKEYICILVRESPWFVFVPSMGFVFLPSLPPIVSIILKLVGAS